MDFKISIITISYNSALTIEQTIKSVISQNYKNLEYIIIDGGSTDGTLSIINKYKESINIIVSEKDNGISDAFNKGIKLASGDIIGIINSDDLLNINSLRVLNDNMKLYPNYDVYFGNSIFFENSDNYICRPNVDISKIKLAFLLNHPSVFVKKDAYLKYGMFNVDYKCAMDFELLSKMYINGATFKYIDYDFSWFRKGGVSQINGKRTIDECIKIARRNGCEESEIKKYYSNSVKKAKILSIIKKIGVEKILRKIIKKQDKSKDSVNWYEKY